MSKLYKANKLKINFHSSGAFLNLNKPKLLSIGKSHQIKNLKIKTNLNLSQDTSPLVNITRVTESNSKDGIIKALKDHITKLEKKVQKLEKEKNNKKKLNLSQGNKKKLSSLPSGKKLNMKLIKNKKNFLNLLEMSKTYMKKNTNNNINRSNNNSINTLNNSNYYNFMYSYNSTIEKKINKNRNFFNSIKTNGFKLNNIGIRVNNSASKYKNKFNTIILRNNPKQNLFANVFKRTMIKYPTLTKYKNINNNNKNIPKIPKKKKLFKSEIINNDIKNLINNSNHSINNKELNNENKNDFLLIDNFNGNESPNLNNSNNKSNNNISFKSIKLKLEDIKIRTKNLLEFYSSNKINNSNNISYLTTNDNNNINNIMIYHEDNNNAKESLNFN